VEGETRGWCEVRRVNVSCSSHLSSGSSQGIVSIDEEAMGFVRSYWADRESTLRRTRVGRSGWARCPTLTQRACRACFAAADQSSRSPANGSGRVWKMGYRAI